MPPSGSCSIRRGVAMGAADGASPSASFADEQVRTMVARYAELIERR